MELRSQKKLQLNTALWEVNKMDNTNLRGEGLI
jgi:hypothetical protein